MENSMADICKFAKRYDRVQSLMRFVNEDTLRWSYQELMRGGKERNKVATEYGKQLDENLDNLLRRMKKFSYWPQPKNYASNINDRYHKYAFRAFEDEIVQGVLKEILKAIYEPKIRTYLDNQKRSKSKKQGKYTVKFYKASVKFKINNFSAYVDDEKLIAFLEQDIADRNFIKYIRRFLDSGILASKERAEAESVQHESLPDMLINVYLHYMLHTFLNSWRNECKNGMRVLREQDSYRYLFQDVKDAEKVYQFLRERLNEFGITATENESYGLTLILGARKNYRQGGFRRNGRSHSIRRMSECRLQATERGLSEKEREQLRLIMQHGHKCN